MNEVASPHSTASLMLARSAQFQRLEFIAHTGPALAEKEQRVDSGRSSFPAGGACISQNSIVFKIHHKFVLISEAISREPF
jgi:hypothetical protein